jgi:carbonic anhydrase
MTIKEKMLLENKAWVMEQLSLDHRYFDHLSKKPKPSILWIGSVDNLISIREVTNTEPGEILVHRNMASQVRADDISLMATVEYAVETAAVEYIIICGYSHCSGIREVVQGQGLDEKVHLNRWLEDLIQLYDNHTAEFNSLPINEKEKLLCELNIRAQILKLSKLDIIQNAWGRGNYPTLLGWYFDLNGGYIKEIFSMTQDKSLIQVARLV